jgi:protein-disulfide isomerase
VISLLRTRRLSLCLLACAAGCAAQIPPKPVPVDAQTARRIDVIVRTKLNVPPDYDVKIGPRVPASVPGFDAVAITFELPDHPEHAQTIPFLLSKDSNTLARFNEWDISKDPAGSVPWRDRPIRGNRNAKVVIVNFDDLECPYCARMHATIFPATMDHYKGLVKVVYRDLPLEELHPWAMHAAVNANCLAAQSNPAYWSYVDYLHTHGEDVTGPDRDPRKSSAALDRMAEDQGVKSKLNRTKLAACIDKQDEAAVRDEMKLATSLGIEQTPTLYVNGEVLAGALPEEALWDMIDRALLAEGITPPPRESLKPSTSPAKSTPATPGQAKTGH